MHLYNVKNPTQSDIDNALSGPLYDFKPALGSVYRLLYYIDPREFVEVPGTYYGAEIDINDEAQARDNKVYIPGYNLISSQTDEELGQSREAYLEKNEQRRTKSWVRIAGIIPIERQHVTGMDAIALGAFLKGSFIEDAVAGNVGGLLVTASNILATLVPGTALEDAKISACNYIITQCIGYKRQFPDLNGPMFGNAY